MQSSKKQYLGDNDGPKYFDVWFNQFANCYHAQLNSLCDLLCSWDRAFRLIIQVTTIETFRELIRRECPKTCCLAFEREETCSSRWMSWIDFPSAMRCAPVQIHFNFPDPHHGLHLRILNSWGRGGRRACAEMDTQNCFSPGQCSLLWLVTNFLNPVACETTNSSSH